jgi:hypothetical protein
MLRSPTMYPTDAPQLRTPIERHAYTMPVVREVPPATRLDLLTTDW